MVARRKHLARNNEVLTALSRMTPAAARQLGDSLSEGEAGVLDGVTAGTGAASKAAVLDASGHFTMPDGGLFGFSVAALAAAGSGQSTYAVIADQVVAVTGADATVGVALPAAAAGRAIYVINTSQTAVLPVSPINGGNDAINSLTAGTGVFTMGPARAAWFIPTSATQWYVTGDAAVVGTPTEQDLDGILATVTEINRTADVSTRIVLAGSTLAVTVALHDGKIIGLDQLAGSVCTLPAATGSGARFEFITKVLATSNSHIIKVADASGLMAGVIVAGDNADASATAFATAADSDTITLNRTTTGSVRIGGDRIILTDIATNVYSVSGNTVGTGGEATPFSATV